MNMRKWIRTGSFLLAAALLFAGVLQYRNHRLQQHLAENILRFHVIANSDDAKDQKLKLQIRDKIGAYLQKELQGVDNREACEQVVNNHLAEIENYARVVIAKQGYSYGVTASVTDAEFPDKTYGNYRFPKGTYRALRVVIGEGAGKNWWCVMYPNLCFANSIYGIVDENSDKELQAALTKEDYEELRAEGTMRVRFRYLNRLFH